MTDNPYSEPESPDTVLQTKNILLSGCGLVVAALAIGAILLFLWLPFSRGREPAYRTQCKNNLKQIGLALHNYHDEYGVFPPAFTVDETGKRLHSWRTLILPYLEQQTLYNSIDLSKPWDDPANQTAYETDIATFRCPSADVAAGHASYLGLVGAHQFFALAAPRNIRDITDGTSNTIMVIEVARHQSVHWMSPQDADMERLLGVGEETEFSHTGGFQAAFADGHVRFLSKRIEIETLTALTTIAGNETVGEF